MEDIEENKFNISLSGNSLSGDIADIAQLAGEVLRRANVILVSACLIIRKTYHRLEDRDKEFIKLIEKESLNYINPVMSAIGNQEEVGASILEIIKKINPSCGSLLETVYSDSKLEHQERDDNLAELRWVEGSLYISTSRAAEAAYVSRKFDKLKQELEELEQLWNDQNFQIMKSNIIKNCELARKQAKGFLDYLEPVMQKYEAEHGPMKSTYFEDLRRCEEERKALSVQLGLKK